jgi:hypothetical protein
VSAAAHSAIPYKGAVLAASGLAAAGSAAAIVDRSADRAAFARFTGSLHTVAATSARSAWAVGALGSGPGEKALILRWNGSVWKRVPSPAAAGDSFLAGVAAASAASAWAVGGTNPCRPLILHWNGKAWRRMPSPSPAGRGTLALSSIAAPSARSAWAVGYSSGSTLILHWNGTAWTRVPSPSGPSGTSYLWGVAATARTAWTVGAVCRSGVPRTLILHWNGAAWK